MICNKNNKEREREKGKGWIKGWTDRKRGMHTCLIGGYRAGDLLNWMELHLPAVELFMKEPATLLMMN